MHINSTLKDDDKRDEYRVLADANVEVITAQNKKVFAACCNISSSGMMIKCNRAFRPSDQLTLKISEAGTLTTVKVTVVHCHEIKNIFYVGCRADEWEDQAD